MLLFRFNSMKLHPGPLHVPEAFGFHTTELGRWRSWAGFLFNARGSRLSFCILLLLVISVGCARPPTPVEKPPGAAFETGKLKERSDFWRDYQCKLRLRVESKTSNFSSRAIVFIKGRDFVRFETFTPFGQTAALYVSNEIGPSLFIPSEKVIFTAQQPETLVHEFLGVTLPVERLWLRAHRFDPLESARPYRKPV